MHLDKRSNAPERYRHSAIPHLMVSDASRAITFYETAYGAKEIFRVAAPNGFVIHSEIAIADSVVMVGDRDEKFAEPSQLPGTTVGIHLYVDDVDSIYSQAVEAGASSLEEPKDMFYGDRMAMLKDPFGHIWVFLEAKENLQPAEIVARAAKMFEGG